jgi:hypothetical protein
VSLDRRVAIPVILALMLWTWMQGIPPQEIPAAVASGIAQVACMGWADCR